MSSRGGGGGGVAAVLADAPLPPSLAGPPFPRNDAWEGLLAEEEGSAAEGTELRAADRASGSGNAVRMLSLGFGVGAAFAFAASSRSSAGRV